MVSAAGDEIVRRGNHSTMSCSRIEYLAGCPFAYFLKNVLYVNPPEEVLYDPNSWLEPMERGLLLHELYCNFMKEIVRRKQRVSPGAHRNMMYEMADELIDRYKIATPPPSDVVFNREVRDIRDSCDIFLTIEESEIASTPVFFEVPFGLPGKMLGRDMGSPDPVRIDLGSGVSFSLRGQIDRIDRVSKDVYRIWDYKTGSSRGYEGRSYLCKGRQVQHALYAIAAEKILKDRFGGEPKVESSGYYFPTRKGEGRRAIRPESDRSLITSLMGHLFDILKNGAFLATDDGEACGYCDYTEVCDQKRAVSRAKALVSDPDNADLDPWRRLKNFE
jgi:ATP-dependent helicase/nuclease subunit B